MIQYNEDKDTSDEKSSPHFSMAIEIKPKWHRLNNILLTKVEVEARINILSYKPVIKLPRERHSFSTTVIYKSLVDHLRANKRNEED